MPDKTIFVTPDADLQGILTSAGPGGIIQLSEGEYRTKCTIFVPGITIRGSGPDKTRIVWNDTDRDRTARFYETPAVPGRVKWVR